MTFETLTKTCETSVLPSHSIQAIEDVTFAAELVPSPVVDDLQPLVEHCAGLLVVYPLRLLAFLWAPRGRATTRLLATSAKRLASLRLVARCLGRRMALGPTSSRISEGETPGLAHCGYHGSIARVCTGACRLFHCR